MLLQTSSCSCIASSALLLRVLNPFKALIPLDTYAWSQMHLLTLSILWGWEGFQ